MTNLEFFPKKDVTIMHVSDLESRINRVIEYFRKNGYQMNGYKLTPTSYNISRLVLILRSGMEKIINLIAVKPDQMDCKAIIDWCLSQMDTDKLDRIQVNDDNAVKKTTYYQIKNRDDLQKISFNNLKLINSDFLNEINDMLPIFTESIIRFKNNAPFKLSDFKIRYNDLHDRIYYSGLNSEKSMPVYWDYNLDSFKTYIPGIDGGSPYYDCNYPESEFRKRYQLDKDTHWSNHNYITIYSLERIAENVLSDLNISSSNNWNKAVVTNCFYQWLNSDHTSGKKNFDSIITEFESEYSVDRLAANGLDVVLDSNNLNLIQEQAVEKVRKFCAELDSEYKLNDYTKVLQLGMKDLKKDCFGFMG